MRAQLLSTASELVQPSPTVSLEFSEKRDELAALGNQIMAARGDLEKLVGKGNHQMAADNNRNFARFMEAMFHQYDPNILLETVLWVFCTYRSHGFQPTYWAANLNIWTEMLRQAFTTDTYNELYPFYNWLIIHIPIFVKLSDEVLFGDGRP